MPDYVESAILGFMIGVGSNLSAYFINKHIIKRIEKVEEHYKRLERAFKI